MNTSPRSTPFGTQLRRYRERAGLTQEALAERAGLTPQAISALERGERQRPYLHTVQALAEALHLADEERAGLLAARAPQRDMPTPEARVLQSPMPPSLTPIIGRDTEMGALLRLLQRGDVRLVTITGPGGVGKTRLALDLVQHAAPQFRDGMVWVSLESVADPALVALTIAAACGVRDAGAHQVLDLLQHVLHAQHLLLVLDNVEHLLPAAPDVAALLGACPQLTVLTTSRAPLHVRGEQEFPIAPLPLPAPDDIPQFEEVVHSPAVQLFVTRAQAAFPNFALTPTNAATVAEICGRLDGLPLALELAAARVKVLDTTALLSRLGHVLPVLTGGARDLPARQHTMRTTIGWSYDLLDAPTQALFRRLSVFRGGWTLEAAEVVGGTDGMEGGEVLDRLARLVDASLVMVERDDTGAPRYRMLEPIRQYAAERLETCGEVDTIRQRHAAYFVALAEQAQPALEGPLQRAWFDRLDREHNNVRAALTWALTARQEAVISRIGWALSTFWMVRGYHQEARRWMEAALSGGQLDPLLQARTHSVAGAMIRVHGEYVVAAAHFEQALATFRAMHDMDGILLGLGGKAQAMWFQGEYQQARALAEEGMALPHTAPNQRSILNLLEVLALVALAQGEHAQARRRFEEIRTRAQSSGNQLYVAAAYSHLGVVALQEGHYVEADTSSRVGLDHCVTLGQRRGIAYNLDTLAALAVEQEQWTRGARLFGAARALRNAGGIAVPPASQSLYAQYLDRLQMHLDEPSLEDALAAGQAMSFEQAIAYALGST